MKRRSRVSRERVAVNARQQASSGKMDWLSLSGGVEVWQPESAGTVRLDILPYEVKSEDHPDRIEVGCLWYKLPFAVHYNVGVDAKSVVCPGSLGHSCPVCEEKRRLAKDWDENEEAARSLTPQKWVIYNILDPSDSDRVAVFAFSRGKFAGFLENELMEGDEDNLNFYDVTSEGRTLKVRFSKEQYAGRDFITATRIDFVSRDEMDETEILGKVVCLEKCLIVLSYDELKSLFEGSVAEADGDGDVKDSGKDRGAERRSESKSKVKASHSKGPVGSESGEVDDSGEDWRGDSKEGKSESKRSTAAKPKDDSNFEEFEDDIPY